MADMAAVGTVSPGDHACLTFPGGGERLDLVAAFVRDGLRHGHKVLCWTDSISPEGLAGELARRSVRPGAALRRGQLTVAAATDLLLGTAETSASAMVEVLAGEVERAGREGYPGLRVTADMCWATRPLAPADELLAFETSVAGVVGVVRPLLICPDHPGPLHLGTPAFAPQAPPDTPRPPAHHAGVLLR